MRLIDRILAIFVGLLLIMLVTIVLVATESVLLLLTGVAEVNLLLRLAVVVVVNILILMFMYLQLRGPRKVMTSGLAVKASGASTDVSVESARMLILNGVKGVKDVVSADVKVKAVNGRADVDLNVQVTGNDIHIPNKQKEIDRALRQVINKQLGLQMRGKPRVHIFLQGETLPAPVVAEKPTPPVEEKPVVAAPPVVADKDDDTVVDAEKPQGLLGLRNRETKKSDDKADETNSDWLRGYEKSKAENEQN